MLQTYRAHLTPALTMMGYLYFLACDAKDYLEHQRWCHEHCEQETVPHLGQFDEGIAPVYPRAFRSKRDAAMFKLTFDAATIASAASES